MSKQDVKELVLPELMSMFSVPFGVADDTVALKAYTDGLADMPVYALKLGWRDVKRDHVPQTRPTLGAILRASRSHIHTEDAPQKVLTKAECFHTPQGQYALEHGHGLGFYRHCQNQGEVIDMAATRKLIERCDRARNEMKNDPDHRMRERWKSFSKSIETGEASLQEFRQ